MSTDSGSILHSFDEKKSASFGLILAAVLLVAIFLGVWSGYFLAHNHVFSSVTTSSSQLNTASGSISYASGQIIGSSDTTTFKDFAEGILKPGGIGDEGQYHLVRSGGDSQNVYLTSSTVDLSQLLNKKIKVWGATQTAKKAGWLMDVGRIQVE